ncbi:enoyl-CoA hydratase/isomerase family protein [Algiphilus sp.]|uniref:enoyl-CoA hydratase/isomerase family protein n=1 Tax=Algiphilus sp. TaxID=1872431 RepID=UPI003BAB6F89
MSKTLSDYQDKYADASLVRENGILEVTLQTDGGPLVWSARAHRELPELFGDIAADRDNRMVILTGAGDAWCQDFDAESFSYIFSPDGWNAIHWEGRRLISNLLSIDVPVIAAVNGPATIHCELMLLADIVIATPDSFFQDACHVATGMVPGDGVHVIWPLLLGMNRGRHFLLTHQKIAAEQAQDLGLIAEVVQRDKLLNRARELADTLAGQNDLTLRYSRLVFSEQIREAFAKHLSHGLALEGLAALSGKV